MEIFDHHERTAGMRRAGHLNCGLKNAAVATRERQHGGRYGPIRSTFNAVGLFAALPLAILLTITTSAMAHVPVILDFGDSLTAGYGLMPEQAFPARLEAWLKARGVPARVVNAGVSGDTTAGGLARLDWALADKPDLVILALGANDALRGIPPATVHANLDKMLEKIKATGAKVLILGMLAPPNWGEAYGRAFDKIYPELARAYGATLYPFFLEGVAMKRDLNQPDGLHPNARGVEVLVDRIGPIVAGLIAPHQGGAS
jgi:acyl-CoA thioesterase I